MHTKKFETARLATLFASLFTLAFALTVTFMSSGCGKSESGSSGEGDKGKGTKKSAAKSSVKELGSTGLKGAVPAGGNVSKAPIGGGVMVRAPGLVVTVAKAKASRPKTLEAAKKGAEMYTPKNIKTEKLDDGWVFTFENKGSMGKNYFVQVRREIGGSAYWCSTTAHKPEQQKNALAFCKSLKK